MKLQIEHPIFLTVTAHKSMYILKKDKHKKIVIDSLRFLVENQRIFLFAFVIMDNHFHLIWQVRPEHKPADVQRDFLKFTAQQIKFLMQNEDMMQLRDLEVNKVDRKFQIWKRNSLGIPLWSPKVLEQKLDYIHENPVKAGLCIRSHEYRYSSASFYYQRSDEYDFLSHHEG
jgi:putative transposase